MYTRLNYLLLLGSKSCPWLNIYCPYIYTNIFLTVSRVLHILNIKFNYALTYMNMHHINIDLNWFVNFVYKKAVLYVTYTKVKSLVNSNSV